MRQAGRFSFLRTRAFPPVLANLSVRRESPVYSGRENRNVFIPGVPPHRFGMFPTYLTELSDDDKIVWPSWNAEIRVRWLVSRNKEYIWVKIES
jgi:hypothetical protein